MKINFLPWRTTREYQHKQQFLFGLLGAVVLAVIAVLCINSSFHKKFMVQQQRNQQLQNQLSQLEQQYQEKNRQWQQQQQLKLSLQQLLVLQRKQQYIEAFLKVLPNLLPRHAHLTTLEITPELITLSGQANHSNQITEFLGRLEKLAWLATPQLLASHHALNKKNTMTFQIKINYKT
jgi:Tfp pilus assembly protein PilN